jgi:hypothetical protein
MTRLNSIIKILIQQNSKNWTSHSHHHFGWPLLPARRLVFHHARMIGIWSSFWLGGAIIATLPVAACGQGLIQADGRRRSKAQGYGE